MVAGRGSIGELLERAAKDRHGLCGRDDVVAVGATRGELRWASRPEGPLRRLHRDVWVLADHTVDPVVQVAAALRQVGPSSVACRRSAGLLLGLDACEGREPDVWVASTRRAEGIRIARTIVHPSALIVARRLPCTDAPTTLLQLGAVLRAADVEAALESALRLGLVTVDQLRARLGWCGATGMGVLREVLDRRPEGAPPTESLAETRFLQLCRRSAVLPEPVRQVVVRRLDGGSYRADFGFGGVLHVEVVGRSVHEGRSMVSDRRRLNAISGLVGLPVCWVTWDDIVEHPEATLLEVERAFLAARRAA